MNTFSKKLKRNASHWTQPCYTYWWRWMCVWSRGSPQCWGTAGGTGTAPSPPHTVGTRGACTAACREGTEKWTHTHTPHRVKETKHTSEDSSVIALFTSWWRPETWRLKYFLFHMVLSSTVLATIVEVQPSQLSAASQTVLWSIVSIWHFHCKQFWLCE